MKPIDFLLRTGIRSTPRSMERNILLCNGSSLILVLLSFLLGCIYLFFYGLDLTAGIIFVCTLLFLLPLLLNALSLISASRLVLSFIFPVLTIVTAITSKHFNTDEIQESGYYDYRFILLVASMFPVIYINLKERVLLLSSLFGSFLCLVLFDPIHNYFGYGYFQMNQSDDTYYFSNVVILLSYILLLATVITLRSYFEKFEHENEEYVKLLNENNKILAEKNDEISAQHEELIAQNEEIISQHDQLGAQAEEISKRNEELSNAKFIIQEQNKYLKVENTELTSELLEKSKHLEDANNELIKHNNELQQFSYAVSHNLRGPVASLLGLIGLFKKKDLSDENQNIFTFIDRSANHLDQIITDLSKIVDIRHSIFQIRQRIAWKEEINQIIHHLNLEIQKNNIQLNLRLEQCPDIFSVRPLIQSILYNLITNAVKYRNATRPCVIDITTSETDTHFILQVRDNGLGIDLSRYKKSLFKLYKRFHLHSEGKGLGLYLVKLQVESLGGTIDVESEVNHFTEFSISIKKPSNISRQIIFEEAYSKFFFNAPYDTCGLVWSGSISSEQYRTTMTRCLELLRVYNTPNWISDAMERGTVSSEDLDWLIKEIVPAAAKNGLRRICFVRKDAAEPGTIAFVAGLQKKLPDFHIEFGAFVTFQSALNWIQEKNLTD